MANLTPTDGATTSATPAATTAASALPRSIQLNRGTRRDYVRLGAGGVIFAL